jgi:outer membrane immunogenic protein
MKNSLYFAAMLAFATMSTSAIAADVAIEPVSDWSGLYLGGHAGYVLGDVDADGDDADIEGFLGGALIGYNVQSDSLVFGIEGDFGFGFGDVDGKDFNSADLSYELKSNAHLRGRLGMDMDMFMPFIAAGLAAGDFEVTEQTASNGDDKTLWGFTLGAGVDVKAAENVVIRAEYLYDDYGSKNFDVYSGVDVGFNTHTIRAALIWQF